MIVAKNKGGNFELIPEGTHQAVCYSVHDIGYHDNNFGQVQHRVIITWEVNETIKTKGEYENKRFVISNRYTLSLNEKATLRKHLESWRGKKFTEGEISKGFDIEKLVGVNCMLSIVHNKAKNSDKTYANVSAVMALAKGMDKMIPENGPEAPDWIKELQAKSINSDSQESVTASNEIPEPDDEVDFSNIESKGEVPF